MHFPLNRFAVSLALTLPLLAGAPGLTAQSSTPSAGMASLPEAPKPQFDAPQPNASAAQERGTISGTVADLYGDIIPGAVVSLDGVLPTDHREVVANDTGGFVFEALPGNTSYRLTIRREGFVPSTPLEIAVAPGQYIALKTVQLKIDSEQTTITVYGSTEQIAVEQYQLEAQQRVLGIIPNFYVVYDSKNAVPLSTKLKFKLAMRVSTDPVSIAGVFFMAGIKQAANTPDYVQGAKGYGQRVGAIGADSFSDILIGGAILPSLLHQDPRYFYQGTGTTQSRLRHALLNPFLCRGDNGRTQINYSSMGGDLASSALSNLYYPQSNRGADLVFTNFAIGTVERMVSSVAQEFVLGKLTSAAKHANKHESQSN